MKARLSKSKIMSGLQCQKRLWLEAHKPELRVVNDGVQRRFSIGHEVNDIACSLHKNGSLIGLEKGFSHALAETKRMLNESPDTPLFEATFTHQGVLVRVDILEKTTHGYRMIEVKSATSAKPQYTPDCAVQAWVLEGNGLRVERVELAHINNQFVYGGDGDYHGLFYYADLTDEVCVVKKEVPEWVDDFQKMLAENEPDISTGKHCNAPYPCPFIEYCSGPSSAYPVTCLPRIKEMAAQLEAEGITDIRDIPEGRLGAADQERVRKATISGTADFNHAAKKVMAAHSYPRYYLDFETIAFAVPVWKDTRPYQALLFQWSCHKEIKAGELTHDEFLDTAGNSPMREAVESLLKALDQHGPIFVYSSYEKQILNGLAARFADLKTPIKKVVRRLVDMHPITKLHYYHPDMLGSWSLKAVLPTIAPSLDYGDLGEVQDGTAAGTAYSKIIHPDTDRKQTKTLTADLLAYCKRDTEALVALARFLASGEIQ